MEQHPGLVPEFIPLLHKKESQMHQARSKKVVFVGGGHAHLYSLKHADRLIREGAEVIVVGPDRHHYYSGMGPGMLSRIYSPEEVRVDIPALIEPKGATFVRGHVIGINPDKKTLDLDTGETLDYDLVSFNVGSYVPLALIDGAEKEAYPVKPIERLESLRQELLSLIDTSSPKILIIGAGPAGVEIAGNIWRLVNENNGKAQITLVGSEDRVLPRFSEKAGRFAYDSLAGRGITILGKCMISAMGNKTAHTAQGKEISYDIAVLTIGIQPKQVFAGSGVRTARNGSLLVNTCLQSVSHPEIFGGGDCITLEQRPLEMVGVYAVKQAPILFDNIISCLSGKPLKEFRPQKKYLLIFNLGDGTGIFVRGSFVVKAKSSFILKDYIDRRFISQFQVS
jgi:NADH dehydrogenase FAD-containing subunit